LQSTYVGGADEGNGMDECQALSQRLTTVTVKTFY
jgi:hypothetical protein